MTRKIIFLIIIILVFTLSLSNGREQEAGNLPSGLDQPFSDSQDNPISHGNPISYAGNPNCKGENRLSRPTYRKQPQVTFWGHGIPLVKETRLPELEKQSQTDKELRESTLSGKNLLCSPKCCPSPYSCDGGCLCYSRDVNCFRYDGKWKD